MVRVNKWIFWIPRILGIMFILFLAVFSFDVFESCNGFFGCALALFIHNIPSLVLLILLIISWKHEIVGAITFILAGLLYITAILISALANQQFEWYMLSYSFIIAGPAFLVGILFFIGWKQKRKKKIKHKF
jgi:hypothetical protein